MQLSRGAVVQNVPRLAAKTLAVDARVGAQLGPQVSDSIPRSAQEASRHVAIRLGKPGPRLHPQPVGW
jgi:hypothetical protein